MNLPLVLSLWYETENLTEKQLETNISEASEGIVLCNKLPSMITVNIAGAIGSGDAAVKVQEILDGIMPNLVPFAMTLGIYGLLQKKVKVSWILIVLMIVGIVGALLGIF